MVVEVESLQRWGSEGTLTVGAATSQPVASKALTINGSIHFLVTAMQNYKSHFRLITHSGKKKTIIDVILQI